MKLRKIINQPPEEYYKQLAIIESGNNPNAKAKTSSASGLYQFTKGTWQDLTKRLNLNYTLNDRFDPVKSKEVVRAFTQQNENYLKNKLNREPNQAELYLAHFSGAGGAEKLLKAIESNPKASVETVYSPAQISANKNVFTDKKGNLKTVTDIYNWAANKFGIEPKQIKEVKQDLKQPTIDVKEFIPTQQDNTKIPSLTNTPFNPNYTIPSEIKQDTKQPKSSITKEEIQDILSSVNQQQNVQPYSDIINREQTQEIPVQQTVPNLDHLYNYINIETYADGGTYKVKSGDTLSKIAKRNNISLNELLDLNTKYKANPNQIRIGDELKLKQINKSTINTEKVEVKKEYPKIDFSLKQPTDRKIQPKFYEQQSETTKAFYRDMPNLEKKRRRELDVNELSDIDDIKRAQTILYYAGYDIGKSKDRAIDGKLGNKTRKALEDFKNNRMNSTKLQNKNILDNTVNLVPLSVRQFTYDTFGGEGELNERDLSKDDYEALKSTVIRNIGRDKMKLDYDDWRESRGITTDTRDDDLNLSDPYSNLQKTLGQAAIKIDNKGDIFVEDTYNFNDAGSKENRYKNIHTNEKGLLPLEKSTSFSNKLYRIARNFKTEYGRKEGGSPVKIYIGNLTDIF